MTDLVTRLRELANHRSSILGKRPEEMEEWEAAKEISELREVLKPFADEADRWDDSFEDHEPLYDNGFEEPAPLVGHLRRARAKLEGSGA